MGIPVRNSLGAEEARRSPPAPREHLKAAFSSLTAGHGIRRRGDGDTASKFARQVQLRLESLVDTVDTERDPGSGIATASANLMACISHEHEVDAAEESAATMSELTLRDAAISILPQANRLPTMTFKLLDQESRA